VTRPDDESQTDSAWREIVENYGERAHLEPEDHGAVEGPLTVDQVPPAYAPDEEPEAAEDEVPEVERFRPPEAPPVALPTTWQRRVAWAGVFVAPVLALLLAVLQVYVAPIIGWALVAWFVGGFIYLVATMSRTPREPWDDGSRI
jgi:hypothetical protein